jgi:hypothetical protein
MVRPVGFTCREVVACAHRRKRIHVLFCVNCWCDVLASSVPRPLGAASAPCSAPHAICHTIPLFHFITFHNKCGAVVQPPHGRGGLDFPLASHAEPHAGDVIVCVVCFIKCFISVSKCVRRTVHTPARRGGCTGSDPGLTRGMATLNRVCERGTRCMSRASQHENEKRL